MMKVAANFDGEMDCFKGSFRGEIQRQKFAIIVRIY